MPSLAEHCFRGPPLGHELGTLRAWLHPSSSCPICVALGRALPARGSVESDSLDIMHGTGWSRYSTWDLWCDLSDVAMALHQWEEDDHKMSRPGNLLRECFCHMGSEVLSDILLKSPVALFVIKEKRGGAWAIHLHMLQILKCGISLQNVKDHAGIPRECGWVWTSGLICYSDFQQQSIFLGWGLDHSYLRFQRHQHI